jgi:effector-binding domain-containing protein
MPSNTAMISTPEILTTKEQASAVIHLTIPGRDMPKYMDPAIHEIIKTLADQGMQPAGPMFSYHHRRPSDTFDFEIGFPVAKAIKPAGRVVNSTLPAVQVVRAVYQGPYEGLAQGWGALQSWVREQKIGETGRFWESYLNNPNEVKSPSDYRTELNWIVGE